MFKTIIASLAFVGALAGVSMTSATTASAHPIIFPIHGGFHPVFPGGGFHPIHPIHPIGPIVYPFPHHHPHGPGFGFGVTIVDGGYGGGYAPDYVSCGEAKGIVRDSGFHGVSAQDCSGAVYSFTGFKHGSAFAIDVNNRGRVLNVDRI